MANSIEHYEWWLKLSCAYEHINPALLDVLHNDGPNPDPTYKGVPRDPKMLYFYLSQSRKIINKLRNGKIITQAQYELLFPPGCIETDSQNFDPTLKKVMIRTFTKLKTANKCWEITKLLPDDTSIAANTIRAVEFIMSVYNSNPAAMEMPEFEYKFTQADNIFKRIEI